MNSEKRKCNLLLKPDLRKRINQTTLKTYSEKADLSEVYKKNKQPQQIKKIKKTTVSNGPFSS